MNRYHRSKIDSNHPEIVQAFRALGWYILSTAPLKAACDLMVIRNGRVIAVEIKDGSLSPSKRKLSEGEAKFRHNWCINGGEYALITSVDDVLTLPSREY